MDVVQNVLLWVYEQPAAQHILVGPVETTPNLQRRAALPGESTSITKLVYASVFNLTTPSRASVAMELAATCHTSHSHVARHTTPNATNGTPGTEAVGSEPRHDALFCLGLSSAFIVPRVKDQIAQLLPNTDVVVCDAGELAAWCTSQGEAAAIHDIETNAIQLLSQVRPGGMVVVTNGSHGCVVASNKRAEHGGGKMCSFSVLERKMCSFSVPQEWKLTPDSVRDTTGAGARSLRAFLER
jgi:sugar/nucleoside kinase (ribokinase family)